MSYDIADKKNKSRIGIEFIHDGKFCGECEYSNDGWFGSCGLLHESTQYDGQKFRRCAACIKLAEPVDYNSTVPTPEPEPDGGKK